VLRIYNKNDDDEAEFMTNKKAELLKYYKRSFDENLMKGTSGNASLFDEENNIILITPSSVDHTTMTEEDIVQLDLKGNIIGGKHKPSSEWRMHLRIITECKHARAVLHTHSPYATAYSVIDEEIPYVLAEMKYWTDGAIPVSPFGPIGSKKLGINAAQTLKDRSTCLLQNHGTIAVGPTLELAYMRAAYIEDAAQICSIAKGLGTIKNSFVTEE